MIKTIQTVNFTQTLKSNWLILHSKMFIARCTRRYASRARMELPKYQIKEALKATTRGERRATMCVLQPDSSNDHFTISNFIRLSCVFKVARLYLHDRLAWLSSLQLWTWRQKTRIFQFKTTRTRGRNVLQLVPLNFTRVLFFFPLILSFITSTA